MRRSAAVAARAAYLASIAESATQLCYVLAGDRIAVGRAITVWRHPGSVGVVSDGELEPTQMIKDMLGRQTQHWETAVAARARIDEIRGAEPRSAVPAYDGWLAPFRGARRESRSHLRSH